MRRTTGGRLSRPVGTRISGASYRAPCERAMDAPSTFIRRLGTLRPMLRGFAERSTPVSMDESGSRGKHEVKR